MSCEKRNLIRKEVDDLPVSGIELVLHTAEYYPGLSLGIGEPNFITPQHIIDAAIDALKQGKTHYSIDEGSVELRSAIAEKYRRDNGFEPDPETNIIVTPGTSPALYGAIQTVVNAGDEVIIPTPAYFSYDSIVRMFNGKPVQVPGDEENGFVPTQEALVNAVSSKTKLLVICSPNNPTGSVWEKEQLKAAVDLAEDHDFLILSDELYEKLVYDDVKHHSVASLGNAYDRTITINGLSKSHAMTGFRIGWIIAPSEVSTNFTKIHQHATICASVVSQAAAVAALNGPQNVVDDMVREYDRRRTMMLEKINRDVPMMQVRSPKGSFFMFANVKELIAQYFEKMKDLLKAEGKEFLQSFPSHLFTIKDMDKSGSLTSMLYLAHTARIMAVSGSFFGLGGEGYLRLSYAQEFDQIESALERLVIALDTLM
jgi:aspartate/methionine/tyrosine aminotransferase